MRHLTSLTLLASTLAAGALLAPFVNAQSTRPPTGSKMEHEMMGDRSSNGTAGIKGMMKQMDSMMDHCRGMMSEERPNQQWRKDSPSQPDKNG